MENVIAVKSYAFALNIVRLYKYLTVEHKEYVLSKQMLRSGTSIGALVREAEHAQSKADFLNKMNIALKEANETVYWLELLTESHYLDGSDSKSVISDSKEILRLLISIVKSTKNSLNR